VSKSETESSKAKEPRAEIIAGAGAALRRGEIIVFPTETLYGLGADALNLKAVEKIFDLKGRDSANPIPLLVADRRMLDTLVAEVPPLAEKLIASFWPGPLTIVFPARKNIPARLLNPSGGIGVRISSQPVAREIINQLGRPLTATSANPSGKPGARTVEEAKSYFAGKVDIFVDGGELPSKTGSTVIEITKDSLAIIRSGEISTAELQRVIGEGKILP
jgi:L-threonylcarbamoyladenylate synthase